MNRCAKIAKLLLTAGFAGMVMTAGAAQAMVYDFTFTGSVFTISDGVFQTSGPANGDGSYDIVNASGTLVSSEIGAPQGAVTLTPGNATLTTYLLTGDGSEEYSNVYVPGAPDFGGYGIELGNTTSGLEVNIYNAAAYPLCAATDCLSTPNGGGSLYNPGDVGVVTITPVLPTPEPASWALMLLGVGMLGATLRTARRNATSPQTA
jgi:PEP-CTERM motif